MVMECEEDVYVDILDEGPVDKGNVESGEFDRWDGGSVSGADDSDHSYSRYRHEDGDYGGSRSYKVRSVVESRHEAEDKGGSLGSRHLREAESDDEEGEYSRRRSKCESGDKGQHKRNYRRKKVVDGYSSDKVDEERFDRKFDMHECEDKEHERNYRRRRVVDDEFSDKEAEEKKLFMGKHIMHGSEAKEHHRNYRHEREVDDDYSDDKAKEDHFPKKHIICGSGNKEHKRNYRRRRVVDDDYSDDEIEEQQISSKHIARGSGDKQRSRNSKRRRLADDDYSDENVEFADKPSKECDDSGIQEWHSGKILSRRHSRSRDEKTSVDYLEKDRGISRHRDDSHERKRGLQQDKHLKHGKYEKEDKYNRRLKEKDIRHSTRHRSENDDEDDDWEREIPGKERNYDYRKEKGRSMKEEKYDRRRDMHKLARYHSEHDDDRDWERETVERERCSWEQGREMNDYSRTKREKDRDYRVRDKESLMRTLLVERGKGDVREKQSGAIWEESQDIDRHVKGRLGSRETTYETKDLRIQITEAKENSHRRELRDLTKERNLTEQQSKNLDMSIPKEIVERLKERDFRGRDRECMVKSREIERIKGDKEESLKLNVSESTINKWEREPRGMICEKEKIHKVIRKKDLTERDITSMGDSHKKKWDREIGEIISKRDFREMDSRNQEMEDLVHIGNEADSVDYNVRSREMSQEIEWERKTRQRYQKQELVGRDKRGTVGRHDILERDGLFRLDKKFLKKHDKEIKEEHREKGFSHGREATRRDFVERDVWKPDKEIREKRLETGVMHKENERVFMAGDLNRESHQRERLHNAETKRLRAGDKTRHYKTLENDSEDNGNRRDLMIWDVDLERSQQNKLLNKEDGSRREVVKISHENKPKFDSVDKEDDRSSVERDNDKCTKNLERETVRDLQEQEEKCRKQRKETRAEEVDADAGTETERQQKTVFAYQISTEANDKDVFEFFSKAGKVRDVRLVMDPISRHFIGVGYIEFYHSVSIPVSVSLSGRLLHGQPVMVKPPKADDNQLHSTETAVESDTTGPCSVKSNRLCVGNLHDSITEALLHQVFEAFGTIELVEFISAEAGQCERKCIIQFARFEDAMTALSINGHLAIAGQLIKVSPVRNHDEVQVFSADTNVCNEAEGNEMGSDIGVPSEVQVAIAGTIGCKEAEGNDSVSDIGVQNEMLGGDAITIASGEEKGSEVVSEPRGIELNKSSSPVNVDTTTLPSESFEHHVPLPSIQDFLTSLRAVLQVPGAAIPFVDTVGVPSECLHLTNMFDSNMQAMEDFELRLKENVEEQCYKFGKPKEIRIDKMASQLWLVYDQLMTSITCLSVQDILGLYSDVNLINRNSVGCVFVRFADMQAAIVAQRALHGRWFAGKMITATYMELQSFEAKFPNIEQTSTQGQLQPAWLPHNYGSSFPISGQTIAQGPNPAAWLPPYGSNVPTGQQPPLAPGPTPAIWLTNNNVVAFGPGFGSGGQFVQPLVPQGNIFTDVRPNVW